MQAEPSASQGFVEYLLYVRDARRASLTELREICTQKPFRGSLGGRDTHAATTVWNCLDTRAQGGLGAG